MRRGVRQAGYALMTLLFLAALVLILLSVAVPRVLTQGQREREEELIFRGEQYRRALALHYRKFGRLPLKLDELAEPKTGIRFLRKLYPDPMTEDGQWRLIRVGPLGELVGSVTREKMQMQAPGQEPKPDEKAGEKEEARPGEESEEKPEERPFVDTSSGGVNLPIIGVASKNPRRSIKLFQNQTTYRTWEFIFDPVADALLRGGPGAAPGQPGRPNSPANPQNPP